MRIIESFSMSKHWEQTRNEDAIVICDGLAAVIDGTTSRTNKVIDGMTSGKYASIVLAEALYKIDLAKNPFELLCELNDHLKQKARDMGYIQVPSATIVLCNLHRGEIIRYGDCGLRIGCQDYSVTKKVDEVLSLKRSEILHQALSSGYTVEQLMECDISRPTIVQGLADFSRFANDDTNEYGYPVLNGEKISEKLIECFPLDSGKSVVLASDGYPKLMGTLAESEAMLEEINQQDPLCISVNKSTKGIVKGQASFDDRSYIRIEF